MKKSTSLEAEKTKVLVDFLWLVAIANMAGCELAKADARTLVDHVLGKDWRLEIGGIPEGARGESSTMD